MIALWQFNDNTKRDLFMRYFFLTLFTFLAFPMFAQAQAIKEPETPKALANMVSQGSQIFYLGDYEGMNGWALVRQGKPEFFYENKDRTALVMGLLFNDAGEMVTMAQLKSLHDRVGDDMYAATGGALSSLQKQEMPTAQPEQTTTATTAPIIDNRPLTPAENMYTDLLAANWVTMNPNGKHDVFAFIDPDCPHCKTFINEAQPFLNDDGLRLRIMPMGANDVSARKAAVLLASANPAERLTKYAAGDTSVLTAPENIGTEAVNKNMTTMIKHGFDVTPIIVYRTGKGEIRLIRGRPADINIIINDIENN